MAQLPIPPRDERENGKEDSDPKYRRPDLLREEGHERYKADVGPRKIRQTLA